MKTPSSELRAVDQERPNGNDGAPRANRESVPDKPPEPAWVEDLRRLLQQHGKQLDDLGKRVDDIERRLRSLDGSLTVLCNSYRVQAKELQLLREACPACDADEPVTAEG